MKKGVDASFVLNLWRSKEENVPIFRHLMDPEYYISRIFIIQYIEVLALVWAHKNYSVTSCGEKSTL